MSVPMTHLSTETPSPAATPTGYTELLREVFAEVTRYPLEILEPEAQLEEDLGIDSVKLGEVFSVLRERFDLPEKMGLEPEQLASIAAIAEALSSYLEQRAAEPRAPSPSPVAAPAPAAATVTTASEETPLLETVRQVFAEVTRYPPEILEPEAQLEEDLGIDSVKLGEVFSVLRERYDLPEKMGLEPEQLASIAAITRALDDYLAPADAAPAAPRTAAPSPPARLVGGGNGNGGVSPPAPTNHGAGGNGNGRHALGDPGPSTAGGNGAARPAMEVEGPSHHAEQPVGSSIRPLDTSEIEASFVKDSFAALTPDLRPFAGKVALVTGSGHGLGKEIATYLAGLGASVVVNSFHSRDRGIETTEAIKAAGGEASHVWGSVANPEQVETLFDEVESLYGGVDFLIANASNGMLAQLEDITPHHWEKAFRTNIIGLHQCAMRSVAMMRRRGGGKIITMSSPAAHGYVDYFGCMGAVKAAVESLTRSMAIEFADDNIQVNCVCPGPVYGELLDKWPDSERLIPQWEANTAYPRLCKASDVAHFVAYLLSEPVKLFTGSVLVLDGGISSQGW